MRFFYDFSDGAYVSKDIEGHDCESPTAARAEALRALPEVLLGSPQDVSEREVTCSVRDEHGTVLYRASVTLKVQEMANW